MDCQFKMHKSMAVVGFCINSDCDQTEFYCNECIKEFHSAHQQDCIKFEDGEKLIEKLKENQRSLYESLQNMKNKINMRSHIEKLESNLQKIDQIDEIIKQKGFEELKLYLPMIKHLNALLLGNVINQIKGDTINELETFKKDLDNYLNQLLYPAIFHQSQGNYQQAQKIYESVLKQHPQYLDYYLDQCQTLIELNKLELAIEWIDLAIKIDSNNIRIYDLQIQILRKRIIQLISLNKYISAYSILNKGIKLDKNRIDQYMKCEDWIIAIGIGLLQSGKHQKSLEILDYYIQISQDQQDNKYFNAFYLKCVALYMLQQFDQVIDQIEKFELISNCPQEVYRLKGDTLFQCKHYDEALFAYKKQYQTLFIDNGIEIAYYHLCQQLQKIGMSEKAQNYLKNAQFIGLAINDGVIQQYNQMIVVDIDLVPKTMLQFIL